MAKSFGGAIKLQGESEYQKALRGIANNLKLLGSEIKLVTSQFDKNEASVDDLNKENEELTKKLKEQKEKVELLAKALKDAEEETGENSDTTKKWKMQLNDAQTEVNKTTKEIDKNTDIIKRMEKANVSNTKELKEFEEAEKRAGNETISLGNIIKGNLISEGIMTGIKALGNAIKEVGSKLFDIGKQAVSAFAEQQQLVGGVDTLFKESSQKVQEYANIAYKTAGMSANQYMQTVTSFSASLLQSLNGDTTKSAEVANMAIIDMSDNANKMGTSMEMIQNAYQGFAKQNYTMLDNLKLGYGGTKTEMQRLLADASKLSGIKYDISSLSDVYEAIHVIQQEMGLTGTTALEAGETISGSAGSMQGAWENLLAGIANKNANIKSLVQDLASSLSTTVKNLLPTVKTVVENMLPAIKEAFEAIKPIILDLAKELLPEETFDKLKNAFDDIRNFFNFIKENGATIISTIVGITTAIGAFKIVVLVQQAVSAFKAFKLATEGATFAQWLMNTALLANPIGLIVGAIAGLIAGITALWLTNDGFREAIINGWNNIKEVFDIVWQGIVAFFTDVLPVVWQGVADFFNGIPEWFNGIWTSVLGVFTQFGENIKNFFTQTIPQVINDVFNWFSELPYKIGYGLGQALGTVTQWCIDIKNFFTQTIPQVIENIGIWFSELPNKIGTWLSNTFNKIAEWGRNTINKAIEIGTNFVNSIVNFFRELPNKIWTWLSNTIAKIGQFASNIAKKAKEAGQNLINNVVNSVKELPNKIKNIATDAVNGLWQGFVNMKDWIADKVGGFFKGIVDGAKDALGIHSPSTVFADELGKNMALGVGVGFGDTMANVTKDMQNSIPTEFDTSVNMHNTSSSYGSSYDYLIKAFKQALKDVKVEMNNREMGKFVVETVERVVYN